MKFEKKMLKMSLLAVSCLLGGCATVSEPAKARVNLKEELNKSFDNPVLKANDTLTPVLKAELPVETINHAPSTRKEVRMDFVLKDAPVASVLSALVENSSYSLIMPAPITGVVTFTLKQVTVFELLEMLRRVYDYDYDVQGKTIIVYPNTERTKIFTINHLIGVRKGHSELKVNSGSLTDTVGAANSSGNLNGSTSSTSQASRSGSESARITTTVETDFWKEIQAVLKNMVGSDKGDSIVVSPQTNTIVVKALPKKLREIEAYLTKIQGIVNKQVMIEARLIEVGLNKDTQTGINWAAFRQGNSKASIGFGTSGSTLSNTGDLSVSGANSMTASPGASLLTQSLSGANSLFSLAFQTNNFASIINFLETQGEIQVLSSPRMATMNNQQALLKVGTDEFFVTNVSTTSTSTASGTTNTPTVTTQPFFSGIALDITPQIDESSMVTMHIKPSISHVTTVTKNLNLGSMGNITLPLASSNISETDSVVRVENNQIVAIGGLMKQYSKKEKSQVPGVADTPVVGHAFKNTSDEYQKYELVILLKPQVITSSLQWDEDLQRIKERLLDFDQSKKAIVVGQDMAKQEVPSKSQSPSPQLR